MKQKQNLSHTANWITWNIARTTKVTNFTMKLIWKGEWIVFNLHWNRVAKQTRAKSTPWINMILISNAWRAQWDIFLPYIYSEYPYLFYMIYHHYIGIYLRSERECFKYSFARSNELTLPYSQLHVMGILYNYISPAGLVLTTQLLIMMLRKRKIIFSRQIECWILPWKTKKANIEAHSEQGKMNE